MDAQDLALASTAVAAADSQSAVVTSTIAVNGAMVSLMQCGKKLFSTGSRGFWAGGKVEIGGKRYQVQVQLVEIGSKGS